MRVSRHLLLLTLLFGTGPAALADTTSGAADVFTLVPEMEPPPGIVVAPKSERGPLQKSAPAERGLDRLEEEVRALWPRVREIDLVKLSRYQVEATRDFVLPDEAPVDFTGQVLAWDAEAKRWHLELQGPRLPARFDIVHRYLYFYATYDPDSGELGPLVVTIRGWVLE